MDRNDAIKTLKAELKARSSKAWSVKGGRGTAWGWIRMDAPPRRKVEGRTSEDDRVELSLLFHESVWDGGISIPASHGHYNEYVSRIRGEAYTKTPAYWD